MPNSGVRRRIEHAPDCDGAHQKGNDMTTTTASSVVSAEWLAEHLDDPNVVVLEVSEGRSDSGVTKYADGHIPGAIELLWYRDFVQRLTRDLATAEQITEVIQSAGVNPDSTVVVYGDGNNWFAAYGAWVLKYYGLPDVRLLDGGRYKWEKADGRELTTDVPTPTRGTAVAGEGDPSVRAFKDEVLQVALGERDGVIIDIRGVPEFQGEIGVAPGFGGEAAAKWGHIPGAHNFPWGGNVKVPNDGGDGTFKDVEALRARYAEKGIDGSKPIYVYCRIGERASHTWFALTQILGYDAKVYDGSWTEWGNSVGTPVANPTLEASGGFSGLWGGDNG